MSRVGKCIDCKDPDAWIMSHDRCYKCLKKAREAGVVPPMLSRTDRKQVGTAKKPERTVTVSTVKNVEKLEPVPPTSEKQVVAIPLADLADLASFASSLSIVAEDLSAFAMELSVKAGRINKAAGFVSEARKIIHRHLPR